MKTLGFVGKPDINDREKQLLIQLGKVVARSGRELVISQETNSALAVEEGVKAGKGRVRRTAGKVLTASAHAFVYADERLMTRIRTAYPDIDNMRTIFIMWSPKNIEELLQRLRELLEKRGISYPE